MKLNFKKIASVLAGTVMLSSTIAFAAATALPSPFVKNGQADVLVVYGSNPLAATTDMAAVTQIQDYLNKKVTPTTTSTSTTTGGSTVVEGGEFVELSKASSKLNIGESLNSVYSTLDSDELGTVLADGVYEDTDGDEFDYEQKITLGTTTLSHFADDEVDEDEKPVIGFDIASNTNLLNYTLDFTDNPENASMDDTYIGMLGRNYYISNVADTTSGLSITLLDTANSATVNTGEPVTVTVGDQTYEVELISADETSTPDKATLKVNGVKLDSTNLGNSRKIADDTYISILDLAEGEYAGDNEWVEFSIGTGKLVLKDGDNLEMNDEEIDDVTVDIGVSSATVTQVVLTWTPEDESFLAPDMDLVLPGFEVIKLAMPEFVMSDVESLSIENSGDDYIELKSVDVKDGTVSTFPLLYSNATRTGFSGLGKDSTHLLITSASNTLALNETLNHKFATTYISGDTFESYLWELVSINEEDSGAKNVTKLKNLGDSTTLEFNNADDKDVGELTLATTAVDGDSGVATLTVTHSGGSTGVSLNEIVTEAGLTMKLPVVDTVAALTDGEINTTANPTTWTMNFTEADEDNNAETGASFTIVFGHTSAQGPEVDSISPDEIAVESGSDDKEAYIGGDGSHATKLIYKTGGDNDVLDIEYHLDEAYAKVIVSESSVTVTSSNDGNETDTDTTTSTGVLTIADTDITDATTKNLIVVGGSCVNKVAAELLGLTYGAETSCGANWEAKTSVGAGSYLIQSFARKGKIATLVAGYNAGDTTNAAKAFTTLTSVDTDAGKKFTGTTAATIQSVTA